MDYKQIKQLLDKYLEGNSSLKEEGQLKAFFADKTWVPDELQYAAGMFSAFKNEAAIKPKKRKIKANIYWLYMAASVIILFGLVLFIDAPKPHIVSIVEKNNTDAPKQIILKDGNTIWLNSGAKISYVTSKNAIYNIISLKGEAYFEFTNTQKNNYQILAHNAMIKVETPSRFNVKMAANDENINITVGKGAIKVLESTSDKSLTLLVTEGNYCSVHKSLKLVFASANSNPNYLAWKTGQFIFENMAIATVTDILSEYYPVTFSFENREVAACRFNGTFQNKSLEYMLKKIESNTNCQITAQNGNFIVTGKACL